jgi:hypothetical protein
MVICPCPLEGDDPSEHPKLKKVSEKKLSITIIRNKYFFIYFIEILLRCKAVDFGSIFCRIFSF